MKKTEIQVIKKDTIKYKTIIWTVAEAFLMTLAALFAFCKTWTSVEVGPLILAGAALAGMLFAAAARFLGRRNRFAWFLIAVPWIIPFVIAGPAGFGRGLWMWFNDMIASWNKLHDGGAALITVNSDIRYAYSFSVGIAVIIGEIILNIATDRNYTVYGIFCLVFIIPGFITGHENIAAYGLMISCMLAMVIAGKTKYITWRSVIWSIGIAVVLFGLAHVASTGEIAEISGARADVKEFWHDVRYGKDTLPNGMLHNADSFTESDDEMLTVWCGQEKNTYLKGFVGAIYTPETGEWKEFPGAAYGGDNSGMLSWLESKNFNPLMQVSEYYALCSDKAKPEPSRLTVTVADASRDYAYVPASLSDVVLGRLKKIKDMSMIGSGLTGAKSYTVDEVSSSRPSELTVTEDWVMNPQTDSQKEYVEAEAVYRNFVYENYTGVDADIYDMMNDLFWADFDSENDGIYSAVDHVRKVMKEHLSYSSSNEIPDDEEPVSWFLKESGSGNAALYASAAVLALRTHGIPARYVEGYYIPENVIAATDDGKVSLTGHNSHAWTEVYFDGIGWLPIDVTPGYYYDAVVLQQMVGMPDSSNKTAAYDNDDNSGQIIESDGAGKGGLRDILDKAGNAALYVIGILAIFVVLFTILVVITELVRIIRISAEHRRFVRASTAERVKLTEKWMYRLMAERNINATLGWNTDEVDALVADCFDNIEPGSYLRCCGIIEKAVYGGIEPEPYEERTLTLLASEMASVQKRDTLAERIRLRYIIFKR